MRPQRTFHLENRDIQQRIEQNYEQEIIITYRDSVLLYSCQRTTPQVLGMPTDGHINTFSQKLIAKGLGYFLPTNKPLTTLASSKSTAESKLAANLSDSSAKRFAR